MRQHNGAIVALTAGELPSANLGIEGKRREVRAEAGEEAFTESRSAGPCQPGCCSRGKAGAPPGWLLTVGHEFHDIFRKGPSRMSPGHDLTLHIL